MLPPREVEPTYTRVAHSPRSVPVQPAVPHPIRRVRPVRRALRVLTQPCVSVPSVALSFSSAPLAAAGSEGEANYFLPSLSGSVPPSVGHKATSFLPSATTLDPTRGARRNSPSCVSHAQSVVR